LGTLINYIEPSTAAIIVAGGGGTLLEVINGFLKRCDKEGIDIPVGVLPLGKDNEFFMDCLNSISEDNLPARKIGEATMNVIRGSLSSHHVMKIQVSWYC
jgi:acylglycerol kinase